LQSDCTSGSNILFFGKSIRHFWEGTSNALEELFNQMTELYPHWTANQSWLMFGFPSG
jgi:hypothetical protein